MSTPINSGSFNRIYLINPDDNKTSIEFGYNNLSSICFLEDTKITLSNGTKKPINKLNLKDELLTLSIENLSEIKNKDLIVNYESDELIHNFSKSRIRNLWINPTNNYLVINDKLKITEHHIIHFKRNNKYYFDYSKNLKIGDELLNSNTEYEKVEKIIEIKDNINVYNLELVNDQTFFAEDYLVHHYCKLCSGYSNII
tara:strand:+ start:1414 stop:2010 length:597 start_codon:yes stop_codon:yes gene_type:complete